MHRPVIFFGLALVASLLVFVPTADAALGPHDTATGTGALASESGGDYNTADGYSALNTNTTGENGTAVGADALFSNETGDDNTAAGAFALGFNHTGDQNSAFGYDALGGNGEGDHNTALGADALPQNLDGDGNTAVGRHALLQTTSDGNSGLGEFAGSSQVTGSFNTFLGWKADTGTSTPIDNATAVGSQALVSESNALVLGGCPPQRGGCHLVRVGISSPTPQSRLQLGSGAQGSYGPGAYLQLPVVVDASVSPPASDCNSSTFVGRLLLQYNAQAQETRLWVCPPAGVWTKLAQG